MGMSDNENLDGLVNQYQIPWSVAHQMYTYKDFDYIYYNNHNNFKITC